jgi:hypothetical protein
MIRGMKGCLPVGSRQQGLFGAFTLSRPPLLSFYEPLAAPVWFRYPKCLEYASPRREYAQSTRVAIGGLCSTTHRLS